MILDLKPFMMPEPYPQITHVKPDKSIADKIFGGYCGASSEFTTVMQYNYHSLYCAHKFRELAEVTRGIFHVETLHLQMLGECLLKLGAEPRYLLAVEDKTICWQSMLVDYETTPQKMLAADIKGEKGAAAYYEDLAESCKEQPALRALFLRLAEDEKLHVRILSDLQRKMARR